jgi:hypothetical protein
MTDLQALIRKCEAEARVGNLDEAETLMAYIEKAQADEEDGLDEDYNPDESNPSLDSEDDEDAVDKSLRMLRKAGTRGLNFNTNTDEVTDRGRGHTSMGPVEADTVHSPETYQLSTTAAVGGQQTRHKFMDKVDRIQEQEKVGRTTALTRARQRHPELYTSFQRHTAAQSAPNQAAARGLNRAVDKSAPTCWEEAVSQEMARSGVSAEIAKVRLANAEG